MKFTYVKPQEIVKICVHNFAKFYKNKIASEILTNLYLCNKNKDKRIAAGQYDLNSSIKVCAKRDK